MLQICCIFVGGHFRTFLIYSALTSSVEVCNEKIATHHKCILVKDSLVAKQSQHNYTAQISSLLFFLGRKK